MKRIFIEKTINYLEKEIKIAGWVNTIRSHGKILFLDLRDFTGLIQVVINKELAKIYKNLKPEWVVEIIGKIKKRPANTFNPEILTGEIEIQAREIKILAKAKTLPFPINTLGYEIDEEKRLKYRYLDLRRLRLKKNLKIRDKVTQQIRKFLHKENFIEIETPYITRGTPEGAREFIVPSRLNPGKFYTLPQSPQQFKQLLMVAGFERYFQIARVFRDEDPRADRAYGEATQIDLEMSFVLQEEILDLVERMMIDLVKKIFPEKKLTQLPFPRISYEEAIEKYKTDKPDLRKNKKDKKELAFCFIINWPIFKWNEKEKRWDPFHHIFTLPKEETLKFLEKNPEKVYSWQHDLVLNGYEVGGGSLRITDPKIQAKIFELVGIKKKEALEKFGHILKAFEYGVPPHGGIAIGLDRILIPLLEEPNLREVIAFPKTGDGRDLMMKAPSKIDKKQLAELGLKIVKPKRT